MKAECPVEVLAPEGTDVKYFKDFEKDNSQVSGDKLIVEHLFFALLLHLGIIKNVFLHSPVQQC